jgi:hypothetical protein
MTNPPGLKHRLIATLLWFGRLLVSESFLSHSAVVYLFLSVLQGSWDYLYIEEVEITIVRTCRRLWLVQPEHSLPCMHLHHRGE